MRFRSADAVREGHTDRRGEHHTRYPFEKVSVNLGHGLSRPNAAVCFRCSNTQAGQYLLAARLWEASPGAGSVAMMRVTPLCVHRRVEAPPLCPVGEWKSERVEKKFLRVKMRNCACAGRKGVNNSGTCMCGFRRGYRWFVLIQMWMCGFRRGCKAKSCMGRICRSYCSGHLIGHL